jgi:RPA family protein
MAEIQKRQIAYKIRIGEIKEGDYVKESGWLPNYILLSGRKVSRVNLVGIVVAVNPTGTEFMLEDKSGRITIRTFEEKDYGLNIGDIVLIVGRPREFNNERYVVPEIVRILDRNWLRLRELELCLFEKEQNFKEESRNKHKKEVEKEEKIKVQEEIVKSVIDPDYVMKQIKLLDNGDGADYEELLAKIGDEKIIKMLLEEGEIFEIKPGKIKIL